MEPIIIGRKGSQKKLIEDLSVSREHCKVTYQGDGKYMIENLSPYGTKVDGRDIVQTTAGLNSRLQLGPSYSATLVELIGDVMSDAKPNVKVPNASSSSQSSPRTAQSQTKTFDVSHLRDIWENYNRENIEMADKQRRVNLLRTGLGIFTMCAMPTIFFFGPVGYALTGIGVIGNIYSLVGMKNAETAQERQQRQDRFDDAWVCPNPECGKSIPARNYKMLRKNLEYCPYCKCKYVEK